MLRTGPLSTGHEPRTESLTTCSSVIAWNKIASKRNVLEPYKHNNNYAIPACKNAINTEEFEWKPILALLCIVMSIKIKATHHNTGPYIIF